MRGEACIGKAVAKLLGRCLQIGIEDCQIWDIWRTVKSRLMRDREIQYRAFRANKC